MIQNNVKFALSVEPKNETLQSYATRVAHLRSQGLPSVLLSVLCSFSSLSLTLNLFRDFIRGLLSVDSNDCEGGESV